MFRAETDFTSDVQTPILPVFENFLLSPRAPASVTPVKLAAVVKFRPRCRFAYIQSSSMILHIFAKHGLILDSATADQRRVELCCSQSASLDSLVICSWQMAKSHAHGSCMFGLALRATPPFSDYIDQVTPHESLFSSSSLFIFENIPNKTSRSVQLPNVPKAQMLTQGTSQKQT